MRILFFFISFFVIEICYCQKTKSNNIQLIYPKTNIEAKKEINSYLLLNSQKKEYFKSILDINSIFLTNKQYLPIKNYIENYNSNDNFKEFLDFKNKWFIRYCNIEDIFNS